MSPLTSYRRLVALAGPRYVVLAFLARLPMAMSQLGTLLLVSSATGRYAAGGLASGALALGTAVGAPVAGTLADRWGQRPVVAVQSVGAASGLVGIVLLVGAGTAMPAVVTTAAATGLLVPQVGPLARVRWPALVRRRAGGDPRLVSTAFSYESAADEASFVLGPALVGGLVALVDPAVALVVAAVLLATFGTAFALHPTARIAHSVQGRGTAGGRLLTPELAVLVAAMGGIGVVFGGTQTGLTVLATEAGTPGLAGVVYGLLGVGSAAAGVATAWVPARFGHERRLVASSAAMVLLAAPLLLVQSLAAAAFVVTALGLAVAPAMISAYSTAERLVPGHRAGAAMTLLASGAVVGYAAGAAVAGRLGDLAGSTAALVVPIGGAAAGLVLALATAGRLRRSLPAQRTTPHSRVTSSA
ncbi:MAG TPA: MFS transporter [Jiangellales bacterium]|nr:MFS transporter [Jiangellales bacterium]